MNIVVLVKQVPDIEQVKVDEGKGEVVLPSSPGITNPFDEYAVEEALKLREAHGGKVTALTVGPEKAETVLRNCLALGVDEAVLVSDSAFENSDQQAIGKITAAAIKKIGEYDLVLAGKQAVDSDSAQVPGAVAANLDVPQAMFVKKIDAVDGSKMTVLRMTEEGHDVVDLNLPAVVSVVKEINEPRLPSLKGKMKAKKAPLTKWTAGDLGIGDDGVGANSYTKVEKAAPPPAREKGEMIDGETPEEIADKLYKKLKEDQAL